jgi:heavy metal translocating P-type ATPase
MATTSLPATDTPGAPGSAPSPAEGAGRGKRPGIPWSTVFLLGTVGALAAGGAAKLLGAGTAGDVAWSLGTLAAAVPLARSVLRGIWQRQAGVDVIALLAMVGAIGLGEYLAGAVIAVMFASGQSLDAYASGRAQRELRALLERAPQVVHRYEDGVLTSPGIEEVRPADLLLVRPGEVVPVDGVVATPVAVLDESALTGEPGPVVREKSELVRSGTVNAGGPFDMRATTSAGDSTYAGIIRLVRESQESKAPFVRLADRYAAAFLPFALGLSGVAWLISGDITRALAVLVVATPCPLLLAAPVAIISGISRAARLGIIVKGGASLEALARAETLLLDKTGTLTAGHPAVTELEAPEWDSADELFRLAASLDQVSQHILAAAIVHAARRRGLNLSFPTEVSEEPGRGIRGVVDRRLLAIGQADWVVSGEALPRWVRKFRRRVSMEGSASVFVAVDGRLAGAFVLADPIRPDSPRTIRALRRAGIRKIIMVTGDRAEVAEMVGAVVGVDAVLAERSPAEKVEAVVEERGHGATVMVGDGINDAPALAAAAVGVAMGARGATASSEAADVVLVVDRFDRLVDALRIAGRARSIALQSVVAGMGLSVVAMFFAAGGLIAPVFGAVLQEAIDVAVILNALRVLTGDGRRRVVHRPDEAELGERFRAEHVELLPLIDQMRLVADRLDYLEPRSALAEIERVHIFLVEKLLPHEQEEEAAFYPIVARIVGGDDPTATMNRTHVEIAHLARVLGRLVRDVSPDGPEGEDLPELRRVLYGLHTILRLHFAQEEEAYLSLIEVPAGGRL